MAKTLVDANILLRLLLQDRPSAFAKAQALLAKSSKASLVVTGVTLAEVIYVLRGLKFERARSVQAVQALMAYDQFAYDEPNLANCLDLYASTSLDVADCYLITRSLGHGEALTTQDASMQKAYNRLRQHHVA